MRLEEIFRVMRAAYFGFLGAAALCITQGMAFLGYSPIHDVENALSAAFYALFCVGMAWACGEEAQKCLPLAPSSD